ncbi:hypothetical protein ACFWP5_31185, partial [Streptomyces sp. NPDC058469]|uniref:hypothetical protein n=1 Tax=Streptomyces sp. NPDC058469 TaxID=3346514 RepID=UPI00365BC785
VLTVENPVVAAVVGITMFGETFRYADADAVRSALEEFEAAVEQAHRDSDTLTGLRPPDANHPHDRNHLPKGAEQ